MAPNNSLSVMDLFATLGLDKSGFDAALRQSRSDFADAANDMVRRTEAIQAAVRNLQATLRQGLQGTGPLLNNALGGSLLGGEGAGGGGGAAGLDGGGGYGSGGSQGSQSLITRLTQRFLIYQGLRLAIHGVVDVLHEADDITRRMDQTGWGSRGVQQLESAAKTVRVPIDSLTSSLAHLNESIAQGDLGTLQVLDRLGLKWANVRAVFEKDPEAGLGVITKALQGVTSQLRLGQDAEVLFGDKSQRLLEFIREWGKLKSEADKNPLLSDSDIANLQKLDRIIDRLESFGKSAIAKGVGAFLSAPGLLDFGAGAAYTQGIGGAAFFPPKGSDIELPNQQRGPAGPNMQGDKQGGVANDIARLLDEYRAPHEMAVRKMVADVNEMFLLERQGAATHAQTLEFLQRVQDKYAEETKAVLDEQIRKDTALLTEFGAQGKRTAETLTRDFADLTTAYRQNRISAEEMTEATANYFKMLEDNAARPGLKEAITMFEQGLIGPDELLKARARANAASARGSVEDAFSRGDVGPGALLDAQRRYRNVLLDAPGRTQNQMLIGPNGVTINVVPVDSLSEQVLRRWQQQGLSAR